MMKSPRTLIFKRYFFRLIFRAIIFLLVLAAYIFNRSLLWNAIHQPIYEGFSIMHVLWFILIIGLIRHLLPDYKISMSGLKRRESYYTEPPEGYDRADLLEHIQKMNIGAWKVMLVWLTLNGIIAVLYLIGILKDEELLLITIFYYLSDTVCMVIFCPFQKYIMKNRCCVDCRIFDWGHFMMYTPMLFIKSFFSWSLFFVACVILIRWEITYSRHPERFWEGSNETIKCKNCHDKLCRIRKPY